MGTSSVDKDSEGANICAVLLDESGHRFRQINGKCCKSQAKIWSVNEMVGHLHPLN